MALFRAIYIKFWNDDTKVADEFTPEDKYFYLYLLTNPHTNLCGCYELPFKAASRETGYNEDTVRRLIDRMANVHKVIRFDEDTKEVLIPNWHKYNWTASEKLLKAVIEQSAYIKSKAFRDYVVGMASGDTVSIPYPYPSDTSGYITGSNTDTVSISNKESKSKKFVPPTVDEVNAYCVERNNVINPEYFVDYYASQNWKKANGRPLADWKAAVRQWEQKDKKEPKQEKAFDIKKYAKEQGWFD